MKRELSDDERERREEQQDGWDDEQYLLEQSGVDPGFASLQDFYSWLLG